MSATDSIAGFEAEPNASNAPYHFQILSAYELHPQDAQTPPVTAKLFMSPNFTNPGGADVECGKTRHYVIVLQYPRGVENTVVRMNDCAHGVRLFNEFVEGMAEDKGYAVEHWEEILNPGEMRA